LPVLAVALLSVVGSACGGGNEAARGPERQRAKAQAEQPAELYLKADAVEDEQSELRPVGMDDGPVPGFRVHTIDGRKFDSEELVGNRPFVVVFFATWCQMCEQKMPHLRGALDALGPVTVIGVSVDDPDTWSRVPAFMQAHRLRFPLVRASQYPRFALSYNPFSMVPLVVVVGRNGGLVDYQMGYAPNDRERLIAAVQLARNIGPLADPHGHPVREPHPPSGF
jgi:peroxiredoxin